MLLPITSKVFGRLLFHVYLSFDFFLKRCAVESSTKTIQKCSLDLFQSSSQMTRNENHHDGATGCFKRLRTRFCFAHISAYENDQMLNFFEKMRREKLYKNCIIKYLLTFSDSFPHTRIVQPI